jgi:uncharacterized membrane protein
MLEHWLKLPSEVGPSEVLPQRKPRILAFDLVRLLAMLMMIQGHTLDALLKPDYQAAVWFNRWQFIRGFTAPGFLMLSGFSFMLATSRSWQDYLTLSPKVWRRLRRFVLFIFLGYAMHFPVHRIADLRWLDAEGWRSGLQVDVLQTIGVTLILLQLLVLVARTPKRFAILSLSASAAVVGLSAFIWAASWPGRLPLSLASYLNGATGSLFPLFPWSGYVLLGAGLGAVFTQANQEGRQRFANALAVSGFVLAIAGSHLQSLGMRVYARLDFWHTSPTLFITRAGVVLLILGIALHLKRIPAGVSEVVPRLARESLLVYFVHVCVLYGSIWNSGLRQYWGNNFALPQAAAAAALMIAAVLTMALAWSYCKRAGTMPAVAVRAVAVVAAAWSLS